MENPLLSSYFSSARNEDVAAFHQSFTNSKRLDRKGSRYCLLLCRFFNPVHINIYNSSPLLSLPRLISLCLSKQSKQWYDGTELYIYLYILGCLISFLRTRNDFELSYFHTQTYLLAIYGDFIF